MRRLFHFLIIFVILFSGCSGFRKKFTVGIDPSFYPANMGEQASNVYGFMTDLLEEIAKVEGIQITYKELGSESTLNGLEIKAYDGLLTPKENVEVEEELFSVSDPAFLTGPVLIVPTFTHFDNLDKLEGKIVGVTNQSDSYYLVQKYPKTFIYTYPSPAYLMAALKYNRVDGVLLDSLSASAFVHNLYPKEFKIVTRPLNDEGIYLVTLKDQYPLLIDLFNHGLKKVKKRGVYKKLLKKWNLYPNEML